MKKLTKKAKSKKNVVLYGEKNGFIACC